MAKSESRADRLRKLIGDRGAIFYVPISTWKHRSPGWWWSPAVAVDGCPCDHCVGAREQRPVYLAPGEAMAAAVIGAYLSRHDDTADAA